MRIWISMALLFCSTLVFAEVDTLSVDDILSCETISGLSLDLEGDNVFFIINKMDPEKNQKTGRLYLSRWKEEPALVPLTRKDENITGFQLSPKGSRLIYQLSEKGKTEYYLKKLPWNAPEKIDLQGIELSRYQWIDENTILFSGAYPSVLAEIKKKKKDQSYIFEDTLTFFPSHLFTLDLKSEKIQRVWKSPMKIIDFAASDNGFCVAKTTHSPMLGNDLNVIPYYFLVNYRKKTSEKVFTEKYHQPETMIWGPDKDVLYYSENHSNYEEKMGRGVAFLYSFSLKDKKSEKISLNHSHGLGTNYYKLFEVGKDKIVSSLAKGAVNQGIIIKNGDVKPLKGEDAEHLQLYALSGDGNMMAYVTSRAGVLPSLKIASLKNARLKEKKVLYELNKHLKKKITSKAEVISWKVKDREIEGILYYPENYDPEKKYPLLLNIHGGPFGTDFDFFEMSWAYYPHYWNEKGCFVLFTNYSGSANYGLDFTESIYGRYYELETEDLLGGIDHLKGKGMIDTSMVATMGWSNGSILSIGLLLAKDELFKTACCGAGDVNWISDYGNCRFGVSFDQLYFGGSPWDNREHFIEKSPIFKLHQLKTPTIIFFGDKDTNVPTEQGYQHYRALQQAGKAPVRLVMFPGEPHGLRKYTNQYRKVKEEIRFMNERFFNREEDLAHDFIPKNSPLKRVMKRSKLKKNPAGMLGETTESGILVPETVPVGGKVLGVCEVTVAQWNEYLKSLGKNGVVEKANLNLPITGVTSQEALAYCAWLSKETGRQAGLLSDSLFESLAKPARGNNMAYWLGEKMNSKELDLIVDQGENYSLLMECASFSPSPQGLYDLKGNAAEWVMDEKGAPALRGDYALSSGMKSHSPDPNRHQSYWGFRICFQK